MKASASLGERVMPKSREYGVRWSARFFALVSGMASGKVSRGPILSPIYPGAGGRADVVPRGRAQLGWMGVERVDIGPLLSAHGPQCDQMPYGLLVSCQRSRVLW